MPTRALARFAGLMFTLALTASLAQAQPRTIIAVDPADKAAAFGAADLSDAIARWRVPVTVIAPAQLAREAAPHVVVVTTEAAKLPGQPGVSGLEPQATRSAASPADGTTRWWAIGHDPAGAMYAALELAETARLDGHLDKVIDRQVNPFIARRGIKFNIPLDARTPATPTTPRPARRTSPRCGTWRSGRASSTRWRGTATTCCRCGASARFRRW
jgi:hypothetical protein